MLNSFYPDTETEGPQDIQMAESDQEQGSSTRADSVPLDIIAVPDGGIEGWKTVAGA